MSTPNGRKLQDLRVCDLKDELEKRSQEITGNKNSLIERLQKALKEDGHDPDTFLFEPLGKRTTPLKKTPVTKVKEEGEKPETDENGIVVDEVGTVDKEDEAEDDGQNNDGDMNDNEESINLTIEEDEQKLLHAQAQDGKDEKKTDVKISGNSNNSQKSVVGEEEEEEEEEDEEDIEEIPAENENKDTGGNGIVQDAETAENTESKQKDESEQKSSSKTTATKDEKDKTAASVGSKKPAAPSSRNLWVSGLSSLTRASDLKTIFSKYGKVIGAKVVTNTRTPGTRCYGYVTMASFGDASRCIDHLHRTELHGRIISVERTKSEIGSSSASATAAAKKDDSKNQKTAPREKIKVAAPEDKDASKDTSSSATAASKESKAAGGNDSGGDGSAGDGKKSETGSGDKAKNDVSRRDRKPITTTSARSSSRGRTRNERAAPLARRSNDRERERKQRDVLSFQKIREERERQRLRERERELREEERRRRDIRRRQREEEQRLAKEREKLHMERERLEREKAELLRLERERQKLEREKIELERLELKRQQMKIMQSSRIEETKRTLKRTTDDRYSAPHTEPKRSNTDRRFEAPPPPRFDSSLARPSEKKREDYSSSKRDDYKRDIDVPPRHSSSNSYHNSNSRDTHKDSRYPVPEPPRANFRRDDRENVGRFNNNSRNTGGSAGGGGGGGKRFDGPSSYVDRTSGGGGGGGGGAGNSAQWHNPGPPAIKSFATSQMSNNVPSWQTKSADNTGGGHWRPVETSQDRYDRTYNERSGPYMDPPRQSGGMFVGGGGGRPQDRYGGQMSRYDNGKY